MIAIINTHAPARPGALESVTHMTRHFASAGIRLAQPRSSKRSCAELTGLDQIFEVIHYGEEGAARQTIARPIER